ncbi:MAG: hypothetical protein J7545_07080 [Roseofilum sp. SBFL]|uniref:hypothetical protein n=1 Tax=unclassified Roseofilum TaxID=2620099 RepID=UPI001B05023C|nr:MULTISPECIES: hypothetical protein [unclassified Roseofilum]MBP0014679.1 hypothetical protein [Roseofilum sp. SID3]MBP0023606.1 hypothetical protein [Roseofilum sp. SID2]MBP0041722.1 hypothetical protein [Roseofilum sp. SBFL]
MSKHRWFILGILSFFGFIFAHGSWINRLLAVILCGLLGADSGLCMATVAKYSGKTVAATPAMVQEILLAQRSREFDTPPVAPPPGNSQPVPAFPQDAGPDYTALCAVMRDSVESSKLCTKSLFPIPYSLFPSAKRYIRPDFGETQSIQSSGDLTFVSHTIIGSDRRKIVFQSPSTGLEEVYITTSPNSAEFKILEIWLNNIPNISDTRGKNIKIYFDDSYLAKAELADKTIVLIRQDSVMVTLPNGQTENIPISQSQSTNQSNSDKINYIAHVKQNMEECVDKYIKQDEIVENNVRLAYQGILIAAGTFLGLSTGGTARVLIASAFGFLSAAFNTWLDNAKIESNYDNYRLNKARKFCQAEADNQNRSQTANAAQHPSMKATATPNKVQVNEESIIEVTFTEPACDATAVTIVNPHFQSATTELSGESACGGTVRFRARHSENRGYGCTTDTYRFRVRIKGSSNIAKKGSVRTVS